MSKSFQEVNEDIKFNAIISKNEIARNIRYNSRKLSGFKRVYLCEYDRKALLAYSKLYTKCIENLLIELSEAEGDTEALAILMEIENQTGISNQPCVLDIVLCHKFDL